MCAMLSSGNVKTRSYSSPVSSNSLKTIEQDFNKVFKSVICDTVSEIVRDLKFPSESIQTVELKRKLKDFEERFSEKADNKELSAKLAAANVEKYEATIEELTAALKTSGEELDKIKAHLADAVEGLEGSAAEIQSAKPLCSR